MQKSRQQVASALAASHGSNQSILSNCDSYRSQTYSDASPQICPGRGEPAPLSVTSGGIGSRASALVAGSPPRHPPPPAELGPGHSPGPPRHPRPPAELGPGRQPWSRGARPGTRHLRRNWVQGIALDRPGTHALRRNWVQGVSPGVRGPCAGSPASGDSAGFQKCRGACPLPVRGPRP